MKHYTLKPIQQTLVCVSSLVAIQCLHILKALQLSLNPPRSKLPKLSADITAIVPQMLICCPSKLNSTPFSYT